MLIGGLQKFSLLDYPGKVSCILFTFGCNFDCGYCHNPELIKNNLNLPLLKVEDFFNFLKSRKNKLDAVVITGGEPTIHKDLPEFINKIKKLGYLVKLDTNGTNPKMLESLIGDNLVNYIAMDIKAPLERYADITNTKFDTDKINKSIKAIMKSKVDYEFRTTVVEDQLTKRDFEKIANLIKGAKMYYLQKFIPSKTNRPEFMKRKSYDEETLNELAEIISKKVKQVKIR